MPGLDLQVFQSSVYLFFNKINISKRNEHYFSSSVEKITKRGITVIEDEQTKNKVKETNQYPNEKFKDYNSRASSSVDSVAERANQEIQEQFYGENEKDNLLPFHVDVNNPPIKK
jgi:C4-dicarboxylate-specific signal transduction histidine kinase